MSLNIVKKKKRSKTKNKRPEIPEMFVGNIEKEDLEEMKSSYKFSIRVQVVSTRFYIRVVILETGQKGIMETTLFCILKELITNQM